MSDRRVAALRAIARQIDQIIDLLPETIQGWEASPATRWAVERLWIGIGHGADQYCNAGGAFTPEPGLATTARVPTPTRTLLRH